MADELVARGYDVRLYLWDEGEYWYPGCIVIRRWGLTFDFGTVTGKWEGDAASAWRDVGTVSTDIPGDCTDVTRIADALINAMLLTSCGLRIQDRSEDMNRRNRKAMLAEWYERREQNPDQPLDEFMVMDALIRGYIERAKDRVRKSDGLVRVDWELPAEVREWMDREADRQGISLMELVRRLCQAYRAWESTQE